MSLEAYRRTQKTAESPRQVEYRLFAQVTAALIEAQATQAQGARLIDVLDWNRRLWSMLSTDCSLPGNGLPNELRASIISLGIWVSKYASEVARGRADIDALIDVNKSIMEGLSARMGGSVPVAAAPVASAFGHA